jgi:hypothetical protein
MYSSTLRHLPLRRCRATALGGCAPPGARLSLAPCATASHTAAKESRDHLRRQRLRMDPSSASDASASRPAALCLWTPGLTGSQAQAHLELGRCRRVAASLLTADFRPGRKGANRAGDRKNLGSRAEDTRTPRSERPVLLGDPAGARRSHPLSSGVIRIFTVRFLPELRGCASRRTNGGTRSALPEIPLVDRSRELGSVLPLLADHGSPTYPIAPPAEDARAVLPDPRPTFRPSLRGLVPGGTWPPETANDRSARANTGASSSALYDELPPYVDDLIAGLVGRLRDPRASPTAPSCRYEPITARSSGTTTALAQQTFPATRAGSWASATPQRCTQERLPRARSLLVGPGGAARSSRGTSPRALAETSPHGAHIRLANPRCPTAAGGMGSLARPGRDAAGLRRSPAGSPDSPAWGAGQRGDPRGALEARHERKGEPLAALSTSRSIREARHRSRDARPEVAEQLATRLREARFEDDDPLGRASSMPTASESSGQLGYVP